MIIIDANGICHQAKHSMGNLSWKDKETGVIFGFLMQILSISKTMDSNNFVFCWDSLSNNRKTLFPDYKKSRKRENKPEEEQRLDDIAYVQFAELRKNIIPKLGFNNNFMIDGFEADDLIAKIVFTYKGLTDYISIISTDEDLRQLLDDTVYIYSTRKKQSYTKANLWSEYKITPDKWSEVKALAGCSSDGVPGISGVGEKTAAKYLTKTLNVTSKAFKSIQENEKLINFNRRLVKLPLEETPEIKLVPDSLSFKNFQEICDDFGLRSFQYPDRIKEWKENIFY